MSKSQRKEGLIMVGFHATPEERALLRKAAELGGFETLADYLRWIAENQPVPKKGYEFAEDQKPKE